jgi:uncharacterized protein (TIGR02996 family)
MHEQFLAILRANPGDIPTWRDDADWLDNHGDPTGPFIRLSLELTAGLIPAEAAGAKFAEFEKLYATSHLKTRELLALYRSGLPTRFRVLSRHFIGESPPREMFGYARTVTVEFLEAGGVVRGMAFELGAAGDGRPRPVQTIMSFPQDVEEMAAGREPIQAGLGWLGHLHIEVGSVLSVAPATGQACGRRGRGLT